MTLEQLQAKREEILARTGVVRASFGDRSVEYSEARKALELIDDEIAKLESSASSRTDYATHYATFRKGPRSGFSE